MEIDCSNIFSNISPKAKETKDKNKQMGLHQTKKFFAQQSKPSTKQKDKLLTGKRYLLLIHLVRGYYPKFMKNSYNSTPKQNK